MNASKHKKAQEALIRKKKEEEKKREEVELAMLALEDFDIPSDEEEEYDED
jgi:hypothetical protein